MNQILLILCASLGVLLFITLICLFFVSRKSQRVMHSLLEIMTHPQQTKIQDASRVLALLLKDEIEKIGTNFKSMSDTLQNQISKTEEIKQELTTQNDKLLATADDATKKIANMSQRMENTVDGLQTIVNSAGWDEVQHVTDEFSAQTETLLNKISETTATTSEHANQIQTQINQCIESEKQISEQLQSNFHNNTESMNGLTTAANELQKQLTDLSNSVRDGFDNVKTSSEQYDETMHQNDKMLNDFLTKLSEFSKKSGKELVRQSNTLTETANLVASAVRLAETSIDKQIRKLESAIESLNNSTTDTQTSVRGVTTELTGLTNRFNDEIKDFSQDVVQRLQDVSGVANNTLENTKIAATEFADSVKSMGVGVRETLIEMNKAHVQLSGQSATLIKMSTETTEQLKPLSELIEKYYKALPDLSSGSKEMSENIEQIVNTLVDKINLMKTSISESLQNINDSSVKLGDLAGQSRQQMIDLMSDYTKAVDAMQSLNKQMMIARASTPMEAIKVSPAPSYKPVSAKDFLASINTVLDKLYEQSVDLTRASGAEIPDIVWKKYNDGDNKIFAKWMAKMLGVSDKKQIRELIKSDKVFYSQATQFIRNFDKILDAANQTNDSDKIKSSLLKNELGIIYNALHKNI